MYMGFRSFVVRSAKAIDRLFVILTLAYFFFIVFFDLETTLIYAYADPEHKRQAIVRALGDTAAPGVAPANYTVTDEDLLKRLYGL